MNRYYAPLLPEKFYHVFNRTIGNEKCFLNEDNYLFFLKKLEQYIFPVADVYAYSLLPNHFHLVIKVRSDEEIADLREKQTNKKFGKEDDISIAIMQQFSNLINSYQKPSTKFITEKAVYLSTICAAQKQRTMQMLRHSFFIFIKTQFTMH